jgi:hypothetical protein
MADVQPNPANDRQSLRYLQDQAARGAFDGHTSAYLVLLYLTMNMWTKVPNNEDADLGMVMYGRSSVDDIAAHTTLSRRTVQACLKWLHEAGWIDTERAYVASGRETKRYILVLLDSRAHRDRARIRSAGEAAERILTEASRP